MQPKVNGCLVEDIYRTQGQWLLGRGHLHNARSVAVILVVVLLPVFIALNVSKSTKILAVSGEDSAPIVSQLRSTKKESTFE